MIITVALTIALTFKNLMALLSFLGAFLCAPLFFIIPAVALLALKSAGAEYKLESSVTALSLWVLLVGIGTAVISIYEYLRAN